MKYLFIISLFIASMAHAQLDNCFRDAKTHGNHHIPSSPDRACADLINAHPNKVEARTSDGKYHLYGMGHIFYVDSTIREIMAGDQTGLVDILKIEINEKKKRILVLQSESVSIFNLEFVGNVSPLSLFKSRILQNASRVKLLDEEDMLAIFSLQSIKIINSQADTRHQSEKFKPKLLNEISGDQSLLQKPTDLVINNKRKEIYVLDSNRLLIFSLEKSKNKAPIKALPLLDARSLRLKNEQLYYLNSQGQEELINL